MHRRATPSSDPGPGRHDATFPAPAGPCSRWVLDVLHGSRSDLTGPTPPIGDGLGRDVQLALYLAYELHYGSAAMREDLEWSPGLLAFRGRLEAAFEAALRRRVDEAVLSRWEMHTPIAVPTDGTGIAEAITMLVEDDDGPSVSVHMEQCGTLDQMRDVVRNRSLYQLKEADGHTFAIPRVTGRTKQLLVRIQSGEYGADVEGRTPHAQLFARTMRALDLDDTPNAHLDDVPASAMLVSNLVSLFGLHRRWASALVGHLCAFELTSVTPMARYGRALRRLGAPEDASRFYDVHVLADAEHEVLALEMACSHAEAHPDEIPMMMFGVRAALVVEQLFARDLLTSWQVADEAVPVGSAA